MKKWFNEEYKFEVEVIGYFRGEEKTKERK